jgi:ribosome modulation factor
MGSLAQYPYIQMKLHGRNCVPFPMISAVNLGRQAFLDGKSESDNPHLVRANRNAWFAGYREAALESGKRPVIEYQIAAVKA